MFFLRIIFILGFLRSLSEGSSNDLQNDSLPTSANPYDSWSTVLNSSYTDPVTSLYIMKTTEKENDDLTTIFDICSEEISNDSYKVEARKGDVMVSFVLRETDNTHGVIKFITERINEIGALTHNISLGVRIINTSKTENLSEIIENELDYLEHCVENPFGIFVSERLWHYISRTSKNYELKLWPLPNIEIIKMHRIAHLLKKLPISKLYDEQDASVEIKAESGDKTKDFELIMQAENLCFKSVASKNKIFIHLTNEGLLKEEHFIESGNHILVPLTTSILKLSVPEIPQGAFVLKEDEIQVNGLNELTYPSIFISIAATLHEISKSINKALSKFHNDSSSNTKLNITRCEICNDLEVFGDISCENPSAILDMLKLNSLYTQMNYVLYQKPYLTSNENELERILVSNFVTNNTAFYKNGLKEGMQLGSLFECVNKSKAFNSSHQVENETGNHHLDSFNPNRIYHQKTFNTNIDVDGEAAEIYWELKTELWVAIGLTMSTLGILMSMAILTFIIIRVCMDDVLEGNPIGSIVMLIALIAQFTSFFPFTLEYASGDLIEDDDVMNSMCTIKIFLVSVGYCLTFSLLLSRAIMLASIGSEGGFLSHVNGYIQTIICFFSFFVQLGLSIQLLIVMYANSKNITCINIYNGNWFWAVIGYDAFILILLIMISPFIFKSQRNYREGILMVITSILCVICWIIWIPLSMIDDKFREIMISLGVQTTAWIILGTLMVPRCFLIVKSIARSDFTQALPSLTSLAFAQANQFISEPSIYECVNPTMRERSIGEESDQTNLPIESYQSPSEVPTLPLRGGRRGLQEQYNINYNEIINPNLSSANKMTRF